MNPKKTKKRFYNKWLFKISLRIPGAHLLRAYGINNVLTACKNDLNNNRLAKNVNIGLVFDLIEFLGKSDPKIWSKRIEGTAVDFYTNDQGFYQRLFDNFQDHVIHRFEPAGTEVGELNRDDIIMAKKYPHGRYQFRVYLQPHKMAGDDQGKSKYIRWLKSQNPRITCTDAVERWFMKTNWNWDRRYVLVEDPQTLLLLKLRNSEVVGKIYNYVISDK